MALWLIVCLLHLFFAGRGRCQYNTKEIVLDPTKHDEQFFSFRTRPDIEAPRWESKVYNESALAPGHWFVCPYAMVVQKNNNQRYVAPTIYDSTNAELVWNGGRESNYYGTYSLDLVRFDGIDMLSFLQPAENSGVVMNRHYAPIRHVRTGVLGWNDNMHDFQIVDDGSKALYLTTAHKRVSPEKSLYFDFDGECEVLFIGFEERDINTDQLLFSWDSEAHIPFDESYAHPIPEGFPQYNNTDNCFNGVGVDYMHGNSIEKLPDGDYLMSARHTYAIYKISHLDGSIVWRLGGKNSDFTFTEGTHFSAQHDARCLFQNNTHMTISLLDNAVGCWEDIGYTSHTNSRGLFLSLNLETMVATEIAHYDHPGGVGAYAYERGNVQTLPNGNVLVSWTDNAHHSEYTADGTLIAEARFLSPLKTYRSFKFPWVGFGQFKPDVHAEVVAAGANGELRTVVYVSWNGDTEAARWSLYETNAYGADAILRNTTERAGFETMISYDGYLPFIQVSAVDRENNLLDVSVSNAIRPLFAPEAATAAAPVTSINSPIPSDGKWDHLEDIHANPVNIFLGGILFGALLLLGLRKMRWPSTLRRLRIHVTYAALGDEEKKGWPEEANLLRESDESIRMGKKGHPGMPYSD